MTAEEALEFVRKRGIVLMSARGPVPSLAEAIAGGPIKGSWWGHPQAQAIYRLCGVVSDSKEILVCRLVDGKVTFVHRRLWPALVRLADRLPKKRLAAIREEHTSSGRHEVKETPFPRWVPTAVLRDGERLDAEEAATALDPALVKHLTRREGG